MQVVTSEKLHIKLWLEDIEESAMAQVRNLANLPFAFKHIAIMPDSHCGYGMPIGGVLATKGVVIPNAVGVDIGCGMCAVKTSLKKITTEELKRVMGRIRELVPVGFEHQDEKQDESLMPVKNGLEKSGLDWFERNLPICSREYKKALKQIGTLGGGNHFIEIQKGSDGFIWIMIHSGSRNFGLQVAEHYNELAIELNEKWRSDVPTKWELAFLPLGSEEGQNYIREMNYCVEFALANRKLMMERCKKAFIEEFENRGVQADGGIDVRPGIVFDQMINIAHNYARMENHFGENVMLHRKGATSAMAGEIGIIPGSQGTKSYITVGKGNREAFNSCSHGAGRKMGRGQAQRSLDLEAEKKRLDDQGIIHAIRNTKDLDEAPGAYKDIDIVMKNQADLVEVLVELTPLGVIKG